MAASGPNIGGFFTPYNLNKTLILREPHSFAIRASLQGTLLTESTRATGLTDSNLPSKSDIKNIQPTNISNPAFSRRQEYAEPQTKQRKIYPSKGAEDDFWEV